MGTPTARFADEEKLFAILDKLLKPPYSVTSLQTFVSGGVAAKFADEEHSDANSIACAASPPAAIYLPLSLSPHFGRMMCEREHEVGPRNMACVRPGSHVCVISFYTSQATSD